MSTPKPAAKPHYLRIRDFILDGIKQRTFAPGAKIPPEVELARQFGVSRMTVNKAIRDLAEAGVPPTTRERGQEIAGSGRDVDELPDISRAVEEERTGTDDESGEENGPQHD